MRLKADDDRSQCARRWAGARTYRRREVKASVFSFNVVTNYLSVMSGKTSMARNGRVGSTVSVFEENGFAEELG